MASILLCSDTTSLMHPEYLGLEGESLASLGWLQAQPDPEQARSMASQEAIEEVWVVASDSMGALNLAAALHHDRPALPITLVSAESWDSMAPRADAAGVSALLTPELFVRRYFDEKLRHSRSQLFQAMNASMAASCAESEASQGEAATSFKESPSASSHSRALVLSVMSASGGAGKSTIAALVAYKASQRGLRVLLVDGDLRMGDLKCIAVAPHVPSLDQVLDDPAAEESLRQAEQGLCVVGAPEELEQSESLGARMPAFLDKVCPLFDVVVVNTGTDWGEEHAALMERSVSTLLLVDQRAASIYATKRVLAMCARCGIPTSSVCFLLNRCAKGAPYTAIDVACLLDGAMVMELKDGGVEVEELMGSGMVATLATIKNDLVQSLDPLLDRLLPQNETSAVATRSAVVEPAPLTRRQKRKQRKEQRQKNRQGVSAFVGGEPR